MGQAKNTILIVDDVELNRDVLSIMFSQSHEIEFAESGPEALEILRKKKEDICAILLDYVMPEMDGLTFFFRRGDQRRISGEHSCLSDYGILRA